MNGACLQLASTIVLLISWAGLRPCPYSMRIPSRESAGCAPSLAVVGNLEASRCYGDVVFVYLFGDRKHYLSCECLLGGVFTFCWLWYQRCLCGSGTLFPVRSSLLSLMAASRTLSEYPRRKDKVTSGMDRSCADACEGYSWLLEVPSYVKWCDLQLSVFLVRRLVMKIGMPNSVHFFD